MQESEYLENWAYAPSRLLKNSKRSSKNSKDYNDPYVARINLE